MAKKIITMTNENKKAIIIGCGITGPVLALSLKRAGIDSVIYEEQDAPLDHVGLIIYVGPSGCNVLKTLGLYDKVKQSGSACKSVEFNNHAGKNIVSVDLGNYEQRFGAGTIAIKRGEINRILREEVDSQGIKIEWKKRLKDIQITKGDGSAIASFENGTKSHGDFLIGCDGINSLTRQIIMPDAPNPQYAGSFVIGGTTDTPENLTIPSNVLSFNFGKKEFFAHCALPSGKIVWWSDARIPEESIREKMAISDESWKNILLEQHKDDSVLFRELVRSTNDKLIKLSIYDLPSFDVWFKGPVCLTGDAIHAVAPHAGQGASLAMESAMMLAKCMRDIPNVKDAFFAYQKLRHGRAKKIKKMSRRNVDMFSTRNLARRWIRNLILVIFPKLTKNQQDDVYGYKIDWNKKIVET